MVFFNGGSNRPEKEILKLSDSYMHPMDAPELYMYCIQYKSRTEPDYYGKE